MKKMKKIIFVLLTGLMLFSLAACGSNPIESSAEVEEAAPVEVENAEEAAPVEAENNEQTTETAALTETRELPVSMKLTFGTFMLEDPDLAVTSEQASELLPLWKAIKSLTGSDTAAGAEIEALYTQIQDAMTSEQISAIEEMDFSQESMQAIQEALGIDMTAARGQRGADVEGMTDEQRAQMAERMAQQAGGEGGGGGGMQGGGPGGQMPNMGDMSEEEIATAQAQRGGGGGLGGASFLIEPLIELLETRAAE